MSVNCKIYLPPQTRLRDVMQVIGLLLGCSGRVKTFDHGDGNHLVVANVKTKVIPEMDDCCDIVVKKPDCSIVRYLWQWEADYREGGIPGEKLIMPRSNGRGIALGKRLVLFFGGTVIYRSCDRTDPNNSYVKTARYGHYPTDGKEWDDFEREKAAVLPLTDDEIEACVPLSAYKER